LYLAAVDGLLPDPCPGVEGMMLERAGDEHRRINRD
jgi:hypothetical protein